ncbi:unnamed protein product [Vicia faba]|uniref:GST C-terminal domain-containing protein n=1 Tax=Vicia faba TaxID=3906 RepID=A0AAV0Z633_VICFA|nr:unnamed protein product [Vicia faba]
MTKKRGNHHQYPQYPLLPTDIHKRAINFQAVSIVSSLIQPLQNLDTLKYIDKRVSRDDKLPWVQSIIRKGFTALEKLLKEHTGRGDTFLAPQLHAASKRFNIDMNEFPILSRLHETYYDIPTFRETLPANQPDAVGQLSQ